MAEVQESKGLIDVNPVRGACTVSGEYGLLCLRAANSHSQKHSPLCAACAGSRDFAPDDFRIRQWLFSEFERVSRLFGFEQFETPVLESEELFVRKAGEEITQQLYNFQVCGFPC